MNSDDTVPVAREINVRSASEVDWLRTAVPLCVPGSLFSGTTLSRQEWEWLREKIRSSPWSPHGQVSAGLRQLAELADSAVEYITKAEAKKV